MRISFKLVLLLLVSLSCQEKEKIDPAQIIISGQVLEYKDLDSLEMAKVCGFCAYYTTNWNDPHRFNPKVSYYIKVHLNNELLAKVTESQSFKMKDLISKNPYMLYGKYKSRIVLTTDRGYPVLETSKFGGQQIIQIKRNDEFDDVLIGPIAYKPKKIEFQIFESQNYPEITPSYIFP